MTTARKDIVRSDEDGFYHCISRCVRRAFLCGFDRFSKKSFDHRKQWVEDRIKFLVTIFPIEVFAYAIQSNHLHLLLHTMHDLCESLSKEDVAKRWLLLYPKRRRPDGLPEEPNELEIQGLVSNLIRIEELRKRLGSISWFMKSVSEYVARRANAEDNCKGRFWEGRFKCVRLDTVAAILNCSIYIDLNPIRARLAETPEESQFTSAWTRIQALKAKKELQSLKNTDSSINKSNLDILELQTRSRRDSWLSPIGTPDGILPIDLEDYLSLLDWTGRQLRMDKKGGSIPQDLAPILERLGIDKSHWVDSAENFGHWFPRVAGNVQSMIQAARDIGQKCLHGISVAAVLFPSLETT